MLLSWGRKPLPVDLTGWSASRLTPQGGPRIPDPREALLDALDSPDGMPRFNRWLAGVSSVALVLPDSERDFEAPIPDILLERIMASGVGRGSVRIVIATGLDPFRGWKGHPFARLRDASRGGAVVHDPDDVAHMTSAGEVGSSGARSLMRGLLSEALRAAARQAPSPSRVAAASAAGRRRPVDLNEAVTSADRIVCVSRVLPDALLGFLGGATQVFPGVASRGSAEALEDLGTLAFSAAGRIDGSPVREDVDAACALLGDRVMSVDVLEAPGMGVMGLVAGDPSLTMRKIAPCAREALGARCRPARTVIAASACDTLESLLRAGAVASSALAPGGTLVLAGECRRGIASEARASRIVERLMVPRLAGGTLVVHTPQPPMGVLRCGARPVRSISTAIEIAKERAGGDAAVVVVPDAAATLPIV